MSKYHHISDFELCAAMHGMADLRGFRPFPLTGESGQVWDNLSLSAQNTSLLATAWINRID